MKYIILTIAIAMGISNAKAQEVLSPELLWKLGRLTPLGISKDNQSILYKVSVPSVEANKSTTKTYSMPIGGGTAKEITETKDLLKDKNLSPDGKYLLLHQEIKVEKVHGKDFYPELDQTNLQVYKGLD